MLSEQNTKKMEPEFLNSWKEISNYMGRGVRTIQRYEVQYGLPIRRPSGRSRSAVMATRAEIDAWVAAAPFREKYTLSKTAGAGRLPSMATIASGLAKMHELRDQMLELRAETHLALNALMTSLGSLHSALNTTQASGFPMAGSRTSPKRTNFGWDGDSRAHKLVKGIA